MRSIVGSLFHDQIDESIGVMCMKVSVVIPALNEQVRIRTVLESLKAQDYDGEIEIIVADGNSTDRTADISREYADKVVIETTRTIAAGRQAGCNVATGEYILFICRLHRR